jgi:hypothetical protein
MVWGSLNLSYIVHEQEFSSDFSSDFNNFTTYGSIMDTILEMMLMLKNNWSLSPPLDTGSIFFTTGWYDTALAMPQVTVTPIGETFVTIGAGATPLYKMQYTLAVNIWVRPDADSNKSIGSAKNKDWQMRSEVSRIIRNYSMLEPTGMTRSGKWMMLGRWRKLDELKLRPVIFRSMFDIKVFTFREPWE